MKLGEILVSRGLINEEQLEKALDAQLIYGGHLGTCLIEKSFIDEAQLGEVLGEVFGVGYAGRECFQGISRGIIDLIPAKVAEKQQAVPFRLEGKTLHVAMGDPTNLQAGDELTFASGHSIQPWVAPEVRIYQALERYYRIQRRLRFVSLCIQLDHADSVPGTSLPAIAAEPAPEPQTNTSNLDEFSEALCRCDTLNEAAEVLLDHAAGGMERSILFHVRQASAIVHASRGLDAQIGRDLKIPIVSDPVFALARGNDHFRGPVGDLGTDNHLYAALGIEQARECMLVPIYSNDRLILLFYGDGGPYGDIQGETEQYVSRARKLGMAFSLVRIKRAIRAD